LDWKAVDWGAVLVDNFLLLNSICKGGNGKKVSNLTGRVEIKILLSQIGGLTNFLVLDKDFHFLYWV